MMNFMRIFVTDVSATVLPLRSLLVSLTRPTKVLDELYDVLSDVSELWLPSDVERCAAYILIKYIRTWL